MWKFDTDYDGQGTRYAVWHTETGEYVDNLLVWFLTVQCWYQDDEV